MFRSLLERAPQQGASEEFTRQFNEAVITMQQAVIDAQDMVLASQTREARLRTRMEELDQRTDREEKLSKRISRYRLVKLRGSGRMAYVLREEFVSEDKPEHYLCTNCAEDGIKSILHYTDVRRKPYDCPRCPR